MLFNSLPFAIFFVVVTILYFWLSDRNRLILLLLSSCYFYMFFIPSYLLILLVLILVDYGAGLMIGRSVGRVRTMYFLVSLVFNLGMLFFFKYFNFASVNLAALASLFHLSYVPPLLSLALPIGLSFHTFQSMSYTIEVYRGNYPPERNLGIFAIYVMFYPQLVAGPIERPHQLLPQFREHHEFRYARVVSGLRRMLIGLFKKMVIADNLALIVNPIFQSPEMNSGPALMLAAYCFSFQIFCDFSGYSDIAIGAAEVMGFRLMENFRQPYLAESIPDFWSRWHISLTTWFRDYVYQPFTKGTRRVSTKLLGILFVFLISGLWHGANWTFLVWGALHGVYFIVFRNLSWLSRPLRVLVVFHLVTFAWIFFRAENLTDAFYFVTHLADFSAGKLSIAHIGTYPLATCGLLVCGLMAAQLWLQRAPGQAALAFHSRPMRWALDYALIGSILLLGQFHLNSFIYFQF